MSDSSLEPIERLVKALRRLPGIGEKTATRLAYFLLSAPESYAAELGEAILGCAPTSACARSAST